MKLTDKQKNTIRLVSEVVLSFMLVISGILFIYSCYTVYKSGPSPFTRESIALAFSKIAVPVYVTLCLAVVVAVISISLSAQQKKLVGARSYRALRERLLKRVDLTLADVGVGEKIEREIRYRRILRIARLSLNIVSLVLPLIYLLNPANFEGANTNTEVLHGMLIYLAFLSPVIIFEIVFVILSDNSYRREIEYLKAAPKSAKVTAENVESASKIDKIKAFVHRNERELVLGLRIALTVSAIVFIAVGIFGGGMVDVLNKAIKICTECIGLG